MTGHWTKTGEKTVVVDLTIRIAVTVPDDWGADMIEFFYGDSSHCISNELRKLSEGLKKIIDAREAADLCCCNHLQASKYVRDATDDDKGVYGLEFESDGRLRR